MERTIRDIVYMPKVIFNELLILRINWIVVFPPAKRVPNTAYPYPAPSNGSLPVLCMLGQVPCTVFAVLE